MTPGRTIEIGGRLVPNTGPSSDGWHDLAEFIACPFRWRNGKDGRKKPPDYFTRGTLLHAGLGAHYLRLHAEQNHLPVDLYWDPLSAVDAMADYMEPTLVAQEADHTAASLAPAVKQAVATYVSYYAHDRVRVLGVEEELTASGPTPQGRTWRFSRGLDLAVEEADGRVWYYDHKSRAGSYSKTSRAYTNDGSFMAMWVFGRARHGDRFGGVVVNYVSVPAKPGDSVHFERLRPARQEHAEADFSRTIAHYWDQRAALEDTPAEHWPKAFVGAGVCEGLYRPCEILQKCRYGL